MRILILIFIFLIAVPLMAQPVYRWVDKDGRVHYGERPPPDVKSESLRIQRPPSQEAVETAEAFAGADLDAEAAQRRAIQQRSCDLAREALSAYMRSDFLYEVDNATGERRMLDEAETARVREETRIEVETRCAGLDEQ